METRGRRAARKFYSEITLCCKSLKIQGKFRGWVFGTEIRNYLITAA